MAAPVVSEPRPAAIEDVHLDEQPSLTPFTYSGSFFSRYELRDGYADHGLTDPRLNREGDAFVYRARLGIETNPVKLGSGQSVLVKFVPQAAGTHAMGGTPETIGDAYPLGLYEAYIRLKGRGFRLDLGRFMMNYGDGLVIGQNDWHEAGRAFQGGRVRLTSANKPDYYTDLFITLIQEGIAGTKSVFKGDQYFYGMYTSLGELGAKGPILDVYLLGRTFGGLPADDSVTPSLPGQDGATTLTLGSRIAQAFTHFDYRLEAGVQVGQSQQARGVKPLDRVAFQADGAVGVLPIHDLRLELGGVAISGEENPNDKLDHAWDPLFPTNHAPLGIADVIVQRSNVLSGNLGVRYNATKDVAIDLRGHALARAVKNLEGNRYVGTEGDLSLIYSLGLGTQLRSAYAIFVPDGDYWGKAANPKMGDPIHFFELQLGYYF